MKLKILSWEFEVNFKSGYWDNKHQDNYSENTGDISMRHHVINIEADNHRAQQCFLHEILHAVAHFWSVELNEKDVERLSEGLYCVLKENGMLNDFPNSKQKEKDEKERNN